MTKLQLQAAISEQIGHIETNHFAYLGPVLRTALFSQSNKIDWDEVGMQFCRQNPDHPLAIQARKQDEWTPVL